MECKAAALERRTVDFQGGGGEEPLRASLTRQLARLDRLAEIGLDIAEALRRQVIADPAEPDASPAPFTGDPALAFTRVSRAVRLSIALHARLIEELQALEAGEQRRKTEARAAEAARREALEDIIERVAGAEHPDAPETVERLVGEARERLREDERFADLFARPVSEIIAEICADLGLSPDWPSLADEAWVREAKARATAESGEPPQTLRVIFVDPARPLPQPPDPRDPGG